ncbi:PAS domain S-box-containing protein/diguanylate cyclase (GGDEF)-like protein [Paucimonas lemoignei]|uniref:PAS domain S-box-containing protein/diguanylate cyclase (GGDEF)-like protein n=1 Tax=Paucimonas lemoignei TaxID=29443 RepID=A0A4R3HVK7_PAULE|nr:EAL domain-containing protein [Paucimonas lemoignei]TCS36804.1 PAS domain S-box-containing protein/diguanylate cyclase (GGDEF)-like protein [Paucimonas lemoignei]
MLNLSSLFKAGRDLSLAARIKLVSGVVLTLVGCTIFTLDLRNEISFQRDKLAQSLQYELDFLAQALTEPVITGDYAAVQQLLNKGVEQPAIHSIAWTDSENHLQIADTPQSDVVLTAPAWFAHWTNIPQYSENKDIIVGGENYGRLRVEIATTPAINQIWEKMLGKLCILLLGIGSLFALLGTLVSNGLRPLYVLQKAAHQFGQGDHALRIQASGPPEMQACIHAFNNMAANIERLLGSLRDSGSRNRLLAVIVEQSNVPIITVDLDGIITSWNTAASMLYGYGAEDVIGRPASMLYHPELVHEFKDNVARIQQAQPTTFEAHRRTRDGRLLHLSISVSPLYDENNRHIGEISISRDITRQKRAEEALDKEKERAQVTLASIADAVVTTDTDGNIDYLNPVAEKLLGWRTDEAYGRALGEIFQCVDEAGASIPSPIEQTLHQHQQIEVRGDALLVQRDGARLPIEHSAAPISDHEGEVIGMVLVFRDVSESHDMARQLSWQASHDALTSLVNRREFERRLETLIHSAHEQDRQHALLYMDLDQFKVVNDTCGHGAGDELLRQLSAVLNTRIRSADTLARLGGDEFGVLLADCPLNKAMEVAEALRESVADFRFAWQDKIFAIGVSIGVVPIVGQRENNTDVMGVADAACYAAKDKGRNQVQASPNTRELTQRRGEMLWVSRINSALEQNRFLLHYQRIVPVHGDDDGLHFEALLRMRDQDGNLVSPMSFIPAAERYNLMRGLDRRVVTLAFEECRKLGSMPSIMISINLSGDSLSDPTLLDFLKRQFAEFGVDPRGICFEVTETAAIANLELANILIRELKAMGCRFSLDDFGSGLSSFGYLKNLPVNYLKIDGSFVRDMARDPTDAAMVVAINNIGHVMGIKTIAEWVENQETLDALRSIGVDYAQGYLLGRPQPMETIRNEIMHATAAPQPLKSPSPESQREENLADETPIIPGF